MNFSIVMCTYNEKIQWIKESVESIQNQSIKDFELIIVNDNPLNDEIRNQLEVMKKNDIRIKVLNNEKNLGLARSLNKGISYAIGKYIVRMDADDISKSDRLEKQLNFLEKNKLDLVSSNCEFINENSESIGFRGKLPEQDKLIKKILPLGNVIVHPSVMFKKDIFDSVNGYRDFSTAQDYDLWLRLVTANCKFGIINEPLVQYRKHKTSISGSKKLLQFLTDEYQKKLYKERKKKGSDSFSNEHFDNYLKKNMKKSEIGIDEFNKNYEVFEASLKSINIKKILILLKTILKDRLFFKKIVSIMAVKVITKKNLI